MTYGSLGAGILTGAFRTLTAFPESDNRNRFCQHFKEPKFSKIMKLLEVMDGISADKGVPLAQITWNWTAQKAFVSSTIVGAQHRRKIRENAAAFQWHLQTEVLSLLDNAIVRLLEYRAERNDAKERYRSVFNAPAFALAMNELLQLEKKWPLVRCAVLPALHGVRTMQRRER